jgi:hypothetical protein
MDNRPTIITLHYVQKDGRRARKVAKAMLHVGNGLYTEVHICIEDGTIETIQNIEPSPVGAS